MLPFTETGGNWSFQCVYVGGWVAGVVAVETQELCFGMVINLSYSWTSSWRTRLIGSGYMSEVLGTAGR